MVKNARHVTTSTAGKINKRRSWLLPRVYWTVGGRTLAGTAGLLDGRRENTGWYRWSTGRSAGEHWLLPLVLLDGRRKDIGYYRWSYWTIGGRTFAGTAALLDGRRKGTGTLAGTAGLTIRFQLIAE